MYGLFQEQFQRYSAVGGCIDVQVLLFCTSSGGGGSTSGASAGGYSNSIGEAYQPTSASESSKASSKKSKKNKKITPMDGGSSTDTNIKSSGMNIPYNVVAGRPNIAELLGQSVDVDGKACTAVVVCGPAGLVANVQNVCFDLQKMHGSGAVDLHMESFTL